MNDLSTGLLSVVEQRRYHRELGWTEEHDDKYGESNQSPLPMAAIAYAIFASEQRQGTTDSVTLNEKISSHPRYMAFIHDISFPWWPKSGDWPKWWNPKDARSNLVRAAAMLIDEIDRLDRFERRKSCA